MAGKSNRKHGRNKNSAAMKNYNAQGRLAKNKAATAKRQARIEAANADKALRVTALRKKGAVARLKRRIAAGARGLESTLAKAVAAAERAGGVQ